MIIVLHDSWKEAVKWFVLNLIVIYESLFSAILLEILTWIPIPTINQENMCVCVHCVCVHCVCVCVCVCVSICFCSLSHPGEFPVAVCSGLQGFRCLCFTSPSLGPLSH